MNEWMDMQTTQVKWITLKGKIEEISFSFTAKMFEINKKAKLKLCNSFCWLRFSFEHPMNYENAKRNYDFKRYSLKKAKSVIIEFITQHQGNKGAVFSSWV